MNGATPVFVFDEVRAPTFHLFGKWNEKRQAIVTVCGQPISTLHPDGHWTDNAARLRRDWVEQISGARLCARCERSNHG